jgi:hypothetical protein
MPRKHATLIVAAQRRVPRIRRVRATAYGLGRRTTSRPFTKESFGNDFRQACRAAGVPGSAHGVRKIAATRAANAGATVAQLEAIFGWSGGVMASRRVAVLQPEYLRRNVGRNVLDVGRIHVSRRLRRLQFPTSPTTPPTPLATDH